jgi:hypothetical protein
MECIIEKTDIYQTVIEIKKPNTYLKDTCIKINSFGADFNRVSKAFETLAICLPQINEYNKCNAILAWTQSIYFKFEHLDRYYHPDGDMSDYRSEMYIIQDRCKKLETYMKQVGNGVEYLLPPECGKEREVAKLVYNFEPDYPVAKRQFEYFESLENNFSCPRAHWMCGEQMSDNPSDL